jgi:hypothetical protein
MRFLIDFVIRKRKEFRELGEEDLPGGGDVIRHGGVRCGRGGRMRSLVRGWNGRGDLVGHEDRDHFFRRRGRGRGDRSRHEGRDHFLHRGRRGRRLGSEAQALEILQGRGAGAAFFFGQFGDVDLRVVAWVVGVVERHGVFPPLA